ncbi:MAG: D-aminoacyl-tRNA deacylase [Trueperaceae bacterium]|nr:D-aminoacyl-tRNA deacylase [Trueperaceae bacterium]
MRALIQRVSRAEVRVDGATVGRIGRGFLILLGVGRDDGTENAAALARKIAKLRVLDDAEGKMNLALTDVEGAALVVSQFTLFADARKGNRPSFVAAAPPERADELYARFVEALRGHGVTVQTGTFQAHMEVELVNDGPVTIWLDGDELGSAR